MVAPTAIPHAAGNHNSSTHPFMTFTQRFAFLVLASLPFAAVATTADDLRIEYAAKTSFNFRVVLGNHVRISVLAGQVTLTGRVEDEEGRILAAETVQTYVGTESIHNLIEVRPNQNPLSDGWIAERIDRLLMVKAAMSPQSLQISVRDGIVTLRGTAQDQTQKERTATYAAQVAGIKSVSNQIVVRAADPIIYRSFLGRQLDGFIDDASITSQLQCALRGIEITPAFSTAIHTHQGTIMISGTAGSAAEKALVTQLAQEVRGAQAVTNTMQVAG